VASVSSADAEHHAQCPDDGGEAFHSLSPSAGLAEGIMRSSFQTNRWSLDDSRYGYVLDYE